jgi:hypothetical protein
MAPSAVASMRVRAAAIGAIYNPRQGRVKNGEIALSTSFDPELPLFANGGTDI